MNSVVLGTVTGIMVAGADTTLIARVVGNLGTPITQATVSSITWQMSDLSTGLVLGTGTFTVATTVFNALVQNDPRWVRDSQLYPSPRDNQWGYNFLAVIGAANLPLTVLQAMAHLVTKDVVQVDVTFNMVGGAIVVQPFRSTPEQAY